MTKIKELSILLVNNGGYGADEFSVSGDSIRPLTGREPAVPARATTSPAVIH
jgi:hypothetical protein